MPQSLSLTQVRRRMANYAQSESLTAAASQACSLTKMITRIAPDGTDVLTVGDGLWVGQMKVIYNVGGANTPTVTVTPATTDGAWTTITLTDQESCILIWTASGWIANGAVGTVQA